MGRPTIHDLAAAAAVSVATVNRVISGSGKVRPATMQRVLEAAKDIGFYGVGALQHRIASARTQLRLGVIIQTPHHHFSELLEQALENAARTHEQGDVRVELAHLDDLSPDEVATRMHALAETCDCLAVLAAEHPLISDAVDRLAAQKVPVIALVSPLSARAHVGYVGLDSWKVGRTAAWAFAHMCAPDGKLGILVGTHRYRCHDLYESGFRSYFREHASRVTLLEPLSTFESDAIARELTEKLLREHADLRGLYVSGGGISGVLAAVRASGKAHPPVVVGHDLMDTTRAGLVDRSLTLLMSHPFAAVAQATISTALKAKQAAFSEAIPSVLVPFEIYTSENM